MITIVWKRIFAVGIVYFGLALLLGDLLVNVAREQVGPLTDLIISSLVVLILSNIAIRNHENNRILNGILAGFFCGFAQLLLYIFGGGADPMTVLSAFIIFGLVGAVAGMGANR